MDEIGDQNKERIFVKMHVDAYRSGLVKALGADLWQTYGALATFMDKEGYCYPSQDRLASELGITRTAAGNRIKRLLAFEWNGKHIVTAERYRNPKTMRYSGTLYKLDLDAAFTIF